MIRGGGGMGGDGRGWEGRGWEGRTKPDYCLIVFQVVLTWLEGGVTLLPLHMNMEAL